MGEMISFKRPDGGECKGYLASAAGDSVPGVVVIQEWWGLNDQIKGVAERLAAAGYRVLVPDLYRGEVALAAKEAEHLMQGLNFGDAAAQDIRGAHRLAIMDSTADKIKMPLMGHWALDDAYFSIDQVEGLERKLTAAGVQFEFHRYKAQHAFANDHAAEEIAANPGIAIGYDPAAAELAWQRTLGFFKHHLG